ncbi:MAG: fibronectin type III domain-containing protein [Staphylococcus equorum]|nr:fibronectin type III domain-containing protein [Staphylococcus equorum]
MEKVDLVNDDMKWRYFDGDEDPNADTWYEEWNKLNGWAYPEGWLDWGVIPMRFTEEDWAIFKGTKFSTSEDTTGQVLAKTDGNQAKSTYFFRHTFTLTEEQANNVYAIKVTARYNDAMTMYLNGSPVGGFHNIPTSNYTENMEYGSQKAVADNEFIEETFIVDDVSSLMDGYTPGEYEESELKGVEGFELTDPYTDDTGNTFIDITLAVEIHANNPDDNEANFELLEFVLNPDEKSLAPEDTIKNISVNAGDNENQINFTWNSLSSEPGFVEVVEGNDVEKFKDTEATIYEATDTFHAYTKFLTMDYYTNKAAIAVKSDKEYLYRVGNDDGYSKIIP